nr:MAG TPA: hypothetical protein [Caudoviricetes sp.]
MTRREIEAMRKEIEAANAHRGTGLKRLYLCDPRKNRECKKTTCAYRDGFDCGCFATTRKECRASRLRDLVGYRF